MEHEVSVLNRDLGLIQEQERKNEALFQSLQKERALRLQCIIQCQQHENEYLEEKNKAKVLNKKLKQNHDINAGLVSEVKALSAKIAAHETVVEEQDKEIRDQVSEIGMLHVQVINLKKEIHHLREELRKLRPRYRSDKRRDDRKMSITHEFHMPSIDTPMEKNNVATTYAPPPKGYFLNVDKESFTDFIHRI